jgi:hypothetical protein
MRARDVCFGRFPLTFGPLPGAFGVGGEGGYSPLPAERHCGAMVRGLVVCSAEYGLHERRECAAWSDTPHPLFPPWRGTGRQGRFRRSCWLEGPVGPSRTPGVQPPRGLDCTDCRVAGADGFPGWYWRRFLFESGLADARLPANSSGQARLQL